MGFPDARRLRHRGARRDHQPDRQYRPVADPFRPRWPRRDDYARRGFAACRGFRVRVKRARPDWAPGRPRPNVGDVGAAWREPTAGCERLRRKRNRRDKRPNPALAQRLFGATPAKRARPDFAHEDSQCAVELHPTALARYLAAIEDLSGTPNRRPVHGSEEIARALRELIAAIVIHPAGRDEPRIEVTGLAKLAGTDLFPQVSLTTAVAGARFVHSRHPNKTGDHSLGFVFILPEVKAR